MAGRLKRAVLCTFTCMLVSVGAVHAATKYVSPSGSDSNSGTQSQPWKTLEHAFAQLSAGDTLYMRGGTYRETGITLSKSGSSGSRITVINFSGETPVVDGAYADFQTIDNTNWELHDSGTQTYRSKSTSFPTSSDWIGSFVADDGELYRLFTYSSLTHLMSTTYTFVSGGNYYRGPGFVRHTDGRIYIRLQNLSSPRDAGVPAGATGNIKTVPSTSSGFNPKDYKVNLSSTKDLVTITGDYITFDGIAFENADRNLILNGDNLEFLSCRIFGHRTGLRFETNANYIDFRWCDMDSGHPPYVSWNEIKSSETATEMKTSIATFSDGNHHLTFEDNRFRKYFDGMTITRTGMHDVTMNHNAFDLMIDDGAQFHGDIYNWEFGWNFSNGPGPGYNGGSPSTANANKKWWHHNVFDVRRDEFGRRVNEGGNAPDWRLSHVAIPTHSVQGSDDAVKIYNNTYLIEENRNNKGVQFNRVGGTTGVHEVYNNIIVQYDDREYQRGLGTGNDEKYDHNLYFKDSAGSFPRFNDYPPSNTDYSTFTAWKSSSSATSNGYDQNSKDADPLFGSNADPDNRDYRPSSIGPAASGAKNLASTGWPGATNDNWLGAVDPNASTGLGAVGPRPRSGGSAPSKATSPSPSNSATGVSLTADLSWTAGSGATSHDVYFGTDSTPDSGESKGNQSGTTYDPGTLNASTTYYWRIDEVNSSGTTTGDVWSFTTGTGGGGGGGGISLIDSTSATTGSGAGGSLTINKPSGVSQDDWMFAGVSVSNSDATLTAPSGWTLVRSITDTLRLSIYRKKAGASEPSNYTWTTSVNRRMSGGIVAFSGLDDTDPIHLEDGDPESGSASTSHSTPTIMTTIDDTLLLSIFADRHDNGSTWTAPSGATEHVDVVTTYGSNEPSLAIFTEGPVDSDNHSHTATASNSSPRAGMEIIALKPGSGGGGDTEAPTVSITSPSDQSTVLGTISVTANASDNVGVVGVQFKLDGANLGSEDTTSPYSVSWDTTNETNGNYTLTAVARDAASNSTTSSGVDVTVSNGGGGGISVVGSTSADTGSGAGGSLTINKPSGVSQDDWMFASVSVSNSDATLTAPSGWTLVRSITDTMLMSTYRKKAGTSEPSSYTWTTSINRRMSGGIVAFNGVNSSTPVQAENGAAEPNSTTSHSTPSITTTGSDTWLLAIYGDRHDNGSTWTPPSGMTEQWDEVSSYGDNDPSNAAYTVGPVSAGSQSKTATASNSSNRACMQIIALQP